MSHIIFLPERKCIIIGLNHRPNVSLIGENAVKHQSASYGFNNNPTLITTD